MATKTEGLRPSTRKPGKADQLAKAKLHRWLAEQRGLIDVETMTIEEVRQVAGERGVALLKDPELGPWFIDRDTFNTKLLSYREQLLEELAGLAFQPLDPEDKSFSAKDKLKAQDMLLNLMGAYPSRQKVVKFLDREVGQMDQAQVRAAKAELQKKLTSS